MLLIDRVPPGVNMGQRSGGEGGRRLAGEMRGRAT